MKPILFSTPMVQAILNGSKTMTRRIVAKNNSCYAEKFEDLDFNDVVVDGHVFSSGEYLKVKKIGDDTRHRVFSKKEIGDVLWVRETHYRFGKWVKNGLTKAGKQKWMFKPEIGFINFRYYEDAPAVIEKSGSRKLGWYKKPSIFMPKEAARIFLEVTNVRVERLQDISEQDAIKEGVEGKIKFPEESPSTMYWKDYEVNDRFAFGSGWGPKQSFRSLWRKINGRDSWDLNPWVWIYEFKQIEKP